MPFAEATTCKRLHRYQRIRTARNATAYFLGLSAARCEPFLLTCREVMKHLGLLLSVFRECIRATSSQAPHKDALPAVLASRVVLKVVLVVV